MARSNYSLLRPIRDFCRDRAGSTIALVAVGIPALLGAAGLTIDAGRAMAAKRALNAQAQAVAMVGANALSSPGATATSVSTAITNWTTANPLPNLAVTTGTPTLSCVTSTSNLPGCTAAAPNAVSVTLSATVSTYFLNAVGRSSISLTSTASAAKAGGNAQPLNVMFVLDATGSMSDTDSGCTVPGVTSPTRFKCALYSVQSVLQVMSTSAGNVGLMIFPGMGTQYSPTSHPCATQPASVKYLSAGIKYQIGTTLDNTYNNGNGALVNASPLVQAVGNTATPLTGCVTNKGGQGSYAAEVIAKAQAALPTNDHRQNVIIFLSDGGFNADSSHFPTGTSSTLTSNQCKQAVTAAQAATTAGVTVYSVAYGASTSNSDCSTDSGYTPLYNPCTAMQAIASDSTKFFTTNTNCRINGSANSVTQLPAIFQAISANLATLTKPRLLSN